MGIKVQANNKTGQGEGEMRPVCPAGVFPAYLVALVDIGTHEDKVYQSNQTREVRKILLVFEVFAKGQAYVVARDYTLSFHLKSTLRQIVEGLTGRHFGEGEGYDLGQIFVDGKGQRRARPCALQIEVKQSQKGNDYNRIKEVLPYTADFRYPPCKKDPLVWSVEDEGPLPGPDWLPYLYGKPLAEVVGNCLECRGNSSCTPPPRASQQQPQGQNHGVRPGQQQGRQQPQQTQPQHGDAWEPPQDGGPDPAEADEVFAF